MPIEIRTPGDDELEALVALDARNFGVAREAGDVAAARDGLDLGRFLVAWDGDRAVAAAGSHALELTVPGGRALPMSGVTWVSVSATHRRRGLARRLMAGLEELSVGRGEPLLGLTASEGGIYERFGYGISTLVRVVEIDRSRAAIDPRWDPEPVELVVAQDHVGRLVDIWDRFRRRQVGEVSRSEGLFRALVIQRNEQTNAALHPDGYALYRIEPHWNDGHPAHLLTVTELVAITPEAHLALWNLLLSVDLVGPIHAVRALAVDDPLPHLLTDPRVVRTVELNDGLWLRVTDPVRCLAARTYRTGDRLVIGIVETVDDLTGGAAPTATVAVGQGGCQGTDEAPDVVACRPALGPLLLGASPTGLARSRRLRADDRALERAELLLGTGGHPHCRTPF
jgi:predicted acetyltransferase